MDNEIIYSFVEILEQPQRVRNIKSKSKIFDYLLEASQTQERFEQFMESLDEYASWASLGIAIMASDMLPTAKIFESELAENFTLPRTPGSFDERNALNKLLSYCGRGLFSQKKHRDQFMRYLVNSLPQEEFNFIVTCLKQTYKNEVYNNFKLMFEHDKMKKNFMDFFSFAIDRSSEKSTEFTNKCFALKSPIRKIVKVGLTMFENGDILSERDADAFAEQISYPNRVELPNVCELYLNADNKIFMAMSHDGAVLIKEPEQMNIMKVIDMIYNGHDTFINFDENNKIVSYITKAHGIEELELQCKNIKCVEFLMPITNETVGIFTAKTEDGSEISTIVPHGAVKKYTSGSALRFVKIKNTYFLVR